MQHIQQIGRKFKYSKNKQLMINYKIAKSADEVLYFEDFWNFFDVYDYNRN